MIILEASMCTAAVQCYSLLYASIETDDALCRNRTVCKQYYAVMWFFERLVLLGAN